MEMSVSLIRISYRDYLFLCRRIWKQQCQQIDNNSSYRTFIIQQINETTATTCNCCYQQQQQYYRNISEDIMRGIVASGNTIGDTTIKCPLNHNYKSRWDTASQNGRRSGKCYNEQWFVDIHNSKFIVRFNQTVWFMDRQTLFDQIKTFSNWYATNIRRGVTNEYVPILFIFEHSA